MSSDRISSKKNGSEYRCRSPREAQHHDALKGT
jgi:hypothetical protein